MHIRQANKSDIDLLVELGRQTFFETFAADNDPEDMEVYLNSTFTHEKIGAELDEFGSLFLIGYPDSHASIPIGYAHLIENCSIPSFVDRDPALQISRLYIKQREIGKGYGAQLMQACLDHAQKQGLMTVWLGVWEHNRRALRFYDRWGFKPVGTQIFNLGRDAQNDWILVRPAQITKNSDQ